MNCHLALGRLEPLFVEQLLLKLTVNSSFFLFSLSSQSEELTQQTSLVKPLPYGILGSPQRRKQMAISGGSPQMKGSFLHRAVSGDKAVENASPKRVRKLAAAFEEI